jgi:hypothetical protein
MLTANVIQQQSVNHLATKLIVTIVNYHERTDRGDVMYTISARWRLILWAVLKASSHRTFVHLVFTELYSECLETFRERNEMLLSQSL